MATESTESTRQGSHQPRPTTATMSMAWSLEDLAKLNGLALASWGTAQ